jgi:ribosomal 50S subunit-recycling heat shock protein
VLIMIVPVSLSGQTGSAILHAQGGVWINGNEAPDASAVFVGDLIETKPGFSATLTLDGSSVLIQAESIAKLQENLLELDHGRVSVGTSRGFRVKVNCILVIPVLNEWTQYEVTDLNGTVQVAARKDDVRIEHERSAPKAPIEKAPTENEQSSGAVVHEGQQSSNDESAVCGAPTKPTAAGTVLNPKLIAGGAGGAAVLLWLLLHGGPSKPPVSNSQP